VVRFIGSRFLSGLYEPTFNVCLFRIMGAAREKRRRGDREGRKLKSRKVQQLNFCSRTFSLQYYFYTFPSHFSLVKRTFGLCDILRLQFNTQNTGQFHQTLSLNLILPEKPLQFFTDLNSWSHLETRRIPSDG
jgi:hypothetical protein